jgi:ribonuclease E
MIAAGSAAESTAAAEGIDGAAAEGRTEEPRRRREPREPRDPRRPLDADGNPIPVEATADASEGMAAAADGTVNDETGESAEGGEPRRRGRRRRGGRGRDRAAGEGGTGDGTEQSDEGTPQGDLVATDAAERGPTRDMDEAPLHRETERAERPRRDHAPAAAATAPVVAEAVAVAEPEAAQAAVAVTPPPVVEAVSAAVEVAAAEPAPTPVEAFVAAPVAPVVAAPVAPVVAAPVAPVVAAPVTAAQPTAAPAGDMPAPAPAARPIDAGSLQSVVEQAGLQWVQTAPSAATQEPEPIALAPRVPRVRKARSAPVAEPLVQIETQSPPTER